MRYRIHYKDLLGKPDIVFTKARIAVFVDSEFWHGKDWELRKGDFKSNKQFWHSKIESNIKRDALVTKSLTNDGWLVIRVWGTDIESNLDRIVHDIEAKVKGW